MKKGTKKKKGVFAGNSGFSIIELMMVLAILGILAAAVSVYINTADSELKTFVFNQKGKFNMARFESVKRGRNVYVDFDFLPVLTNGDGNLDNGYTVWVDDDSDAAYTAWNNPFVDANVNGVCDLEDGVNSGEGDCNGNGVCDTGEGDCIVESVIFSNIFNSAKYGPEIYCGNACALGGPDNDGPGAKTVGGGITAGAADNRFRFEPNGNSDDGLAYFYYPVDDGGKRVLDGPWAIIVNTVGRISVDRWNNLKKSPADWDRDTGT